MGFSQTALPRINPLYIISPNSINVVFPKLNVICLKFDHGEFATERSDTHITFDRIDTVSEQSEYFLIRFASQLFHDAINRTLEVLNASSCARCALDDLLSEKSTKKLQSKTRLSPFGSPLVV